MNKDELSNDQMIKAIFQTVGKLSEQQTVLGSKQKSMIDVQLTMADIQKSMLEKLQRLESGQTEIKRTLEDHTGMLEHIGSRLSEHDARIEKNTREIDLLKTSIKN